MAHNTAESQLYPTWTYIKIRCRTKPGYRMCVRWRTFKYFAADIISEIGLRPSPQHVLSRKNYKTGSYAPGNVEWVTFAEMGRRETERRAAQRKS